jgi:Bacterial Ig domain
MHRRPAESSLPGQTGVARRWIAPGLMSAMLVGALAAPAATLAAAPAPAQDYITTAEDTPVTGNVLDNDSDADGDTLTVAGYTPIGSAYGTLAVATDGTFTYTPAADWHGDVPVTTYHVSDGVSSPLSYIHIHVTAVNDDPVAADDTVTVPEDTATDVTDQLTANDTDIDGDPISVTGVSAATGGGVAFDAGSVTFTPDADACGEGLAEFDYAISDGNGAADSAHATVDVTCVNDAPVAVDDSAMIDQGSGLASYDVLANDTDVDGDTLSLVSVAVDPAKGTKGMAAGEVTFTPVASFHGEVVMTYVVSDGALTDSGTLTVTVGLDITPPTVATPTLAFGSGRVNESAPVRLAWSATDAGAGVASYEVEISVAGGAFAPLYVGTATGVTRAYPFGRTLTLRVRATDLEGNVSAWATSPARKVVAYQAPGSHRIHYSSGWVTVTRAAASSVGYRYATTRGRSASLTFTGRSVEYVAPRTSASGYVKVYVDGHLVGRYNLHRGRTANGRIVVRATWSVSGTHTIKVVNDQGGRRTNLDAFVVLR